MNSKELSEILKLLDSTGGKYVVVEEGKPKYAIMDIDEFKKTANGQDDLENLSRDELIEKINRDIAIWRETQNEEIDHDVLDSQEKAEDETQYYYEIDREGDNENDIKDNF